MMAMARRVTIDLGRRGALLAADARHPQATDAHRHAGIDTSLESPASTAFNDDR